MAVTADQNAKNYTLGRYELFFDRFADGITVVETTKGEGERYFGNTPEVSVTSSSEDLEHYDSDHGVKIKDASVQLSQDRTGAFTTDNINEDNLALMFLGTKGTVTQTSATGVIDLQTAKRGRWYQLGSSQSNPTGVRNVSNVVVKKGSGFSTTVTPTGNYQYDADLGRLFILSDAPDIPDNTDIQITYDVAANTRAQVVSGSNSIYGSLRAVSYSPVGKKTDHFYPYVKLTPDGDFALKGDDWQAIGFAFEILKKGSLAQAYIDGRPA